MPKVNRRFGPVLVGGKTSVQKRMSLARLILRLLRSGKKDWLNKGSTTGDTVRRKELKKLRLKPKLNLVFDLHA